MEPGEHCLLEEVPAPRTETWTKFPSTGGNGNDQQLFPSMLSYESLYEQDLATSSISFSDLINSQLELPCFACPFGQIYPSFVNGYTEAPTIIDSSSYIKNETPPFPVQDQEYPPRLVDEEPPVLETDFHNFKERSKSSSNNEEQQGYLDISAFNMGSFQSKETTNKVRKIEGQPSKNLMAERRRRKRLNDRLSILRSVVPKISKMDRTSILGDTIDYMKELLQKIHKLQGKDTEVDSDQLNLVGNLKEQNMNEVILKNPSKFDVERMDKSTRIEISCAAKPGLLLSTVNTIEALGLDIQQCVISCFNDFSLQASCSETVEHRTVISCENLKQALYRNAGYGGRSL